MEFIKTCYHKLVNLLLNNIDKLLRQDITMIINLFMVSVTYILLQNLGWSIVLGSLITILIFIGKEIYDKYKENPTGFDYKDLIADFIGLFLVDIPLLIIWLI